MASKRRLGRIAVMQTLFEEAFYEEHAEETTRQENQKKPQETLTRNMCESQEEVDKVFALNLLNGVLSHLEEIRQAMADHAPQWPLQRMDRITRSILVIGTYELLFSEDVPSAVVMNEAIDIAKKFGGEESGKFVNGVLNAISEESKKAGA